MSRAGRDREREYREYSEYVTGALSGLRRMAHLLCRDPHRADDIVQTALTRLYVHWRRARAADDLDRYVRAILVRSFLNERRLAWARVRLTGAPSDTPLPAHAPDPDVETREVVRAALEQVPPRQRAVLVLRFLCDLPVAEVSAILGCSEGTVKSQTAHSWAARRGRSRARPPTDWLGCVRCSATRRPAPQVRRSRDERRPRA